MKKLKIALLSVSCLLGVASFTGLTSCNEGQNQNEQGTSIVIEGSSIIEKGKSQVLVAKDDKGNVLTDVKWTSSDKAVGLVDSSLGEFTAISAGSVTITATKTGYANATFNIIVQDATLPNLVIINSSDKTSINKGESLSLEVKNSNGSVVENVSWSSSNTNVAIVGKSNGVVKGIGAGTVTIAVSKSGYNAATIEITVKDDGSTVPTDVFSITYKTQSGVKFDGPTSGKVGDRIEFTVEVTDPNVEIIEVTVNDVAKNKINGKYSFEMPEESVVVKAKIKITNADVSISGDVVAPLALNSEGIYESNEVSIETESELVYLVNQEDGSCKELSITDMDNHKCFTQIYLSSNKTGFKLKGGFNYKFYYSPTTKKTWVKRTQVTTLPSNSNQLSYLFDSGRVDRQTTNPDNVKTVTYQNKTTNEIYSFTKYKNNTSIATVEDYQGNHLADVYKTIENDGKQLRVVDTYVETGNYQVTDRGIDNDQPSKQYSGVYNIYDKKSDFPSNSRLWSYTKDDAEFMANQYSHDYYSLELDFYEAYRGSFTIEDTLKFANLKVSSVSNVSGGFTTTVDSYKTYVDDEDETNTVHYEYDLVLSFDSTGRLLNCDYKVTSYDKTAYDFTNDKFLTGGETRGKVTKQLSAAYTYSNELSGAPSFDYSKYFISNITELKLNNTSVNTDTTKNIIKKGDVIDTDEKILTFKYDSEEALDYWQYGVIASSDETVIGHAANNLPNAVTALKKGTTTLTFGNHTTNTVMKDVSVEVQAGSETFGYYFDGSYGNPNNTLVQTADTVAVYQGQTTTFSLKSSPTGSENEIESYEMDRTDLIDFSYDPVSQICTISPKAGSENIEIPEDGYKVTITVHNSSLKYNNGQYKLYVYVLPHGPFTSNDVLNGTWKASDGSSVVFSTDEITDSNGNKWNKGVLTTTYTSTTAGTSTEVLTFGWKTTSIGYLDFKAISYTGSFANESPAHSFDIRYSYDDNGNIKLGLAWTITTWAGQDSTSEVDILGSYSEGDGEDEDEYFEGVEFTK